jgi:hypothetical protein
MRVAAALTGICFIMLMIWTQRERILTGRNDFSQLYVGATLSGTGLLYDRDANIKEFQRTIGVTMEGVLYSRLPFYAFLLRPLTALPYLVAFGLFAALNLAVFFWFLFRFRSLVPDLPVLGAYSLPLAAAFVNGQDTPLLLGILGLAYLWMNAGAGSRRDFAAGMLLSLCAIKFHMFLLLPIVLLVHKRWDVLRGGVLGGAILLGISFLCDGMRWPAEYARLVLSSELDPSLEVMPNIRGLANGNTVVFIAASIGVLAVFGMIARLASFNVLFATSVLAGLLLSGHAFIHDAVILLFPLAVVIHELSFKPLHAAFTFAVTPPTYLLLLAGPPYNVAAALIFILVLVLIYLSLQKSSASERRT